MGAWRALLAASTRLLSRLDEELSRAHDLALADYEVLAQLSEAPGEARRMADLAEAVMLSRSGLTRRIDGLVAAGLVVRQSCPSDGRGTLAVLTSAGRRALAQAAGTHVRGVREHFVDCLSPDQLASVADALGLVAERLARGRPTDCRAGRAHAPGQPAQPGGLEVEAAVVLER